jgi:DNA-binding transcriptional LysR family regulator
MPLRGFKGFDLLRAVEVFVVVAETGNMTATARAMGMTQSAVSQQIRHLEEVLGVVLIDRTLRPLKLTQAGQVLYEYAERLLLDAQQIVTLMQSSGPAALPMLRVAVLASLSSRLVPPIVLALKDRVPIRQVSVWSGLASEHRKALLDREVDVIITSSALYDVDRLERFELLREPFILLLPEGRSEEQASLKGLGESLPFVRYSARSPIGLQIERHLRRLRLAIPPWVEFDAPDSVVAAVASGQAWAISTPLHLLHGLRGRHRVRAAPLPAPGITRMTHLVARAGELGELPREMAETSREVLRNEVLPDLMELLPWAEGLIRVGR